MCSWICQTSFAFLSCMEQDLIRASLNPAEACSPQTGASSSPIPCYVCLCFVDHVPGWRGG